MKIFLQFSNIFLVTEKPIRLFEFSFFYQYICLRGGSVYLPSKKPIVNDFSSQNAIMKLWFPLDKRNMLIWPKHITSFVKNSSKNFEDDIIGIVNLNFFFSKELGHLNPNQEILKSKMKFIPGYFSTGSVSILFNRRTFEHFWFI